MTTLLTRPGGADAATTPEPVDALPRTDAAARFDDVVDMWGHQSFPASDPPANW